MLSLRHEVLSFVSRPTRPGCLPGSVFRCNKKTAAWSAAVAPKALKVSFVAERRERAANAVVVLSYFWRVSFLDLARRWSAERVAIRIAVAMA